MPSQEFNAEDWVVNRISEENLPFMLADLGWDVWLGNNRGSIYSSHVNYTEADAEYWNFTFADMGKYDVPALVDYIIDVTGHSQITYFGFARGNQQMWYALATDPDGPLPPKIDRFVSLAPCAY